MELSALSGENVNELLSATLAEIQWKVNKKTSLLAVIKQAARRYHRSVLLTEGVEKKSFRRSSHGLRSLHCLPNQTSRDQQIHKPVMNDRSDAVAIGYIGAYLHDPFLCICPFSLSCCDLVWFDIPRRCTTNRRDVLLGEGDLTSDDLEERQSP